MVDLLLADMTRLAGSLIEGSAPWLGALGLISGLLLIGVLAVKEMVRAYLGPQPQAGRWMRTFNLLAAPLLVLFVAVAVAQVLPLFGAPA